MKTEYCDGWMALLYVDSGWVLFLLNSLKVW